MFKHSHLLWRLWRRQSPALTTAGGSVCSLAAHLPRCHTPCPWHISQPCSGHCCSSWVWCKPGWSCVNETQTEAVPWRCDDWQQPRGDNEHMPVLFCLQVAAQPASWYWTEVATACTRRTWVTPASWWSGAAKSCTDLMSSSTTSTLHSSFPLLRLRLRGSS